jgi:CheY-like chemotaxis protein
MTPATSRRHTTPTGVSAGPNWALHDEEGIGGLAQEGTPMAHSVLVVDDRPEIRRALAHILEVDDRVTLAATASDGIEAVEYSKHSCPDAIILDVEMPRMGGLEALPLLRKSCPDCVIVIYSSDPERAKAAPQLGADGCVDKSEDPVALIDLVVDAG